MMNQFNDNLKGWGKEILSFCRAKPLGAAGAFILLAFILSFLLGLLAQLDFSINLMTLITNVALPVALIRLLRRPKAVEAAVSADAGMSLATPSAA
jgi:hypothetical protein